MANNEQIVAYFDELGIPHEQIKPGMWMVKDAAGAVSNIAVQHDDPVLVLRVNVMTVPEGRANEDIFRALLQLNVRDMVHGCYGIDGNDVVAVVTLLSETLDKEELQAAVDDLSLALTTHLPALARLIQES